MREAFETIDLPLSRRRFLRAGLAGLAAGSVWQGLPTRVRAAQGGTLVATSPGDLQFDPYFAQTRAWIVQGQIFSALFDYQGKNPFAPSPQLAESWKETEKTLTLKLRKGVKFHNGRDLTSQDIIDNVNRAKDKSIGHYLFDYFDPSVDGAEAIDRETVKITYKQAYPLKLDDLTLLYIIPKEAMADVATKPVGSGPFKFVSYAPGDKLELQRFEQYWEKGRPHLDRVTVKIIADDQARIANLLGGSADFVDTVAPSDVVRLKTDKRVQVITPPPGGFWYTNVINTSHKPFDNKLVRQAMNWSVDRREDRQARLLQPGPGHPVALPALGALVQRGCQHDVQVRPRAREGSAGAGRASERLRDLDHAGQAGGLQGDGADLGPGPRPDRGQALDHREGGVRVLGHVREGRVGHRGVRSGRRAAGPGLRASTTAPRSASTTTGRRSRASRSSMSTRSWSWKGIGTTDMKARKRTYDRIQTIWAEESWTVNLAFWVIPVVISQRVKNYRHPVDQVPHFAGTELGVLASDAGSPRGRGRSAGDAVVRRGAALAGRARAVPEQRRRVPVHPSGAR